MSTLPTVSVLKTNVSAILTGIDLDDVPDLNGSFQRAVATLIQKADVLEASGRQPIMLYDGVTDYDASDYGLFGGALVDVRPQGITRQPWDSASKMPIQQFDLNKIWTAPSGYRVTFETRTTKLIMRIAQDVAAQRVVIDGMDAITGWALAGNGSGLSQDSTVFYHSPASLRFNLAAAGTQATLTKTLTNSLSLSSYNGVGVAFLALYLPQTAPITSIALRIGSSAGNYIEITKADGFLGSFYPNDFQLVDFDTAGATGAGAVDWSAIDYVQVIVNYNGTAVPNVRFGDLFISLPSNNEVLFYSPNIFIPEGSTTASDEISADEDTIVLRPAAYNIYVQEAAREIAKNQGGDISSALIAGIDLVLEGIPGKKLGLYAGYRGDNPSEEIRTVGSWYDSPYLGNYGYGQGYGGY